MKKNVSYTRDEYRERIFSIYDFSKEKDLDGVTKVPIYGIRGDRNSKFLNLGYKTKFTKLTDKRYVLGNGIDTIAFGNYVIDPVYKFFKSFESVSDIVADAVINTGLSIEKNCVYSNNIIRLSDYLTRTFSRKIIRDREKGKGDLKNFDKQKLITKWIATG